MLLCCHAYRETNVEEIKQDTECICVFIYIYIYNEARSLKNCWGGRAKIITYSASVLIDLIIQRKSACAVLDSGMWPFRTYHIFPHNSRFSEQIY